ncbi:P-loop NTPase [candidate division KSB1 bacterium]|nr:P-loop NTPase [candidate division KSB1 bacterium]
MIISVASGKGGTGKTTIAANLALALAQNVQFLDCDVEEPNGHIFIKPEIEKTTTIGTPIPVVDEGKCTYCGKCQKICEYNAIAVILKNVLVFPELCHSCAGCWLICHENAISTRDRELGVLEQGKANGIDFVHGRLRLGEAMSPPLIRRVQQQLDMSKTIIIDSPPGTSCPVIQAVKHSDFVILVAEPTPFGLNDLKLAVEMVRTLKLPLGVVINRSDIGNENVRNYCQMEGIDILMEIKNDRKIAEAYSRGIPLIEIEPDYADRFRELYAQVERRVAR